MDDNQILKRYLSILHEEKNEFNNAIKTHQTVIEKSKDVLVTLAQGKESVEKNGSVEFLYNNQNRE